MILIGFFILGTIFGSFGSVLLYRLEKISWKNIQGIIFGRSIDRKTKKKLKRYELIPLLSWLIQGGKSLHTKKKLPTLYIRLELLSGLTFSITYFLLSTYNYVDIIAGIGLDILIFWLITNWLFILLLLRDTYTMKLHMFTRGILFIRVTLRTILGNISDISIAITGLISLTTLFLMIYLAAAQYAQKQYNQEEGFGEGDVRLAATIGLLLPFVFLYHNITYSHFELLYIIISYTTLSALIGIIWYIVSSAVNKAQGIKVSQVIPFFPAMIISYRLLLLSFSLI